MMMSRTLHGCLWLVSGLLAPGLLAPDPGIAAIQEGDPEAIFQEGNRRYQENDYQGALEAYRGILEVGLESADLYYNLGNAHFKAGDLGGAILSYERALRLNPRGPDIRANLELARSLTADEIEPLPRFWLLSGLSWWVQLFPRDLLTLGLVLTYLLGAVGLIMVILSRRTSGRRFGTWFVGAGALGVLVFGCTLVAREGLIGSTEWGIVMVEAAAVQSAPSVGDDLTLFQVHEGTRVRVDRTTESWLEIVLEDGRVGWVPSGVLEII
jgi:hypothetical protein